MTQLVTPMARRRQLFLDYLWIALGAIIGALAVVIFLAPFNIAPGGVIGVAIILNTVLALPIGLMVFVLNIPIQIMGYRFLPGGWAVIVRTIFAIVVYTVSIDVLNAYVPSEGIGENVLLNTIFGGVLGGISGGLIFRAGGTLGGTSTLALILQRRLGTPMSTTFLYTDTGVILVAGFVYGWEPAMFAIVALFIGGLATDYIMEGPSVIRTAVIITNQPEVVSQNILRDLARGVTGWEAKGMYTGQPHWVLYVSISRSQVPDLRRLVMQADPSAFLVIGQGHAAYGHGFRRINP